MGNIKEMPRSLANMISAGEVVERPINVVKELVENAIDAKSKTINISLIEGGLKEIKVSDDGIGMDIEDVKLCFLPHATSKIKNEYDLFRITTLGFRGEALSSIASVSEVNLTSSNTGDIAYNIIYRFNNCLGFNKVSRSRGTTIIVKDLFYNTPARLKFLKSKETELALICTLIDKLALSNPNISFILNNDDKLIYKSDGKNNLISLIGSIYGIEAARRVKNIKFNEGGISGEIYYVMPEIYRSNKNQITGIINGRYVKYYALNEVIVEAFKGYLPINKYPIIIIYLNIDPLLVDVNIHPKKEEIKIAEPRPIFDIISNKIKDSLKGSNHIPKAIINEDIKEVKYNFDNFKPLSFNFKEDESLIKTESKLPPLNYVGIVLKTFIVCEYDNMMYLLDQHACAERIRYEFFKKELANPKHLTTSLLTPLTLVLTKDEMLVVKNNITRFQELGFKFNLDVLNLNILEIPLWANKEVEDIIREIISLLNDNKDIKIIDFRDAICKQISCKASIRANDYISKEEAVVLINDLAKCENPYHCPHGRPTIIKFSKKDLDLMFARIL